MRLLNTQIVSRNQRPGITLLEVVISLAIFLFSIVAIGHLVNVGTDRALRAQWRQQAAFLCQSKLAEIAAGAEPLSGQTDATFAEDESWRWSSSCDEAGPSGLWRVQVRVSRVMPDGSKLEVALTRLVFDPALRGSTADPVPSSDVTEEPGSSSESGANSAGTGSSGGNGSSGSKQSAGSPSGGSTSSGPPQTGTKGGKQ